MLSSKDSKQLRGVIDAHTRDTKDVSRVMLSTGDGDATHWCLTSDSRSPEEAPFGSGLFEVNSDQVLVNTLRVRGFAQLEAQHLISHSALPPNFFRLVIVWFNQATQLPGSGGTDLPQIFEVIPTFTRATAAAAIPMSDISARGAFSILMDKTVTLGVNACNIDTTTGDTAPISSNTYQIFDFTLPINRVCHFLQPATTLEVTVDEHAYGGHYDSTQAAGQVSRGLLMAYCIAAGSSAYDMRVDLHCRINYTG